MKDVVSKDLSQLREVKFNPLANYALQIKPNLKRKMKNVSETSLSEYIGLPLVGVNDDHPIYYSDDMGAFEYSKVISSAENRNLIMSLESSTQKLFLWILFVIDYRSDIVRLDFIKMRKLGFKMAQGTFRKSIADLESKRIIQRVDQTEKSEEYWHFFINPQIIWKGDAKQYYKDVLEIHPAYRNHVHTKPGP